MVSETTRPLAQRVAVVTGVSRGIGIGAALAERLLAEGASVLATGWPAHDEEMPWGSRAGDGAELVRRWPGGSSRAQWLALDLEDAEAPGQLLDAARETFGAVDFVIAAHARSSHEPLERVTATELDRCWRINARASVLLAQSLRERFDPKRGHGRLILFTSGQHIGPMGDEIAYAVSKGAIHQMTRSLSDRLVDLGITVNCINPGPVDTGYLDGQLHERVAAMFPARRWGQPEDIANIVAWLCSAESSWITGQVLDAEGGFRRWARLGRLD